MSNYVCSSWNHQTDLITTKTGYRRLKSVMDCLNARLDRLVFCILVGKVSIHLSILNIQFRSRPYPLTLQGGLAPLTLACFRDNIELVRTSMHSAHFQQTILFFLLEPSFWIPFLSIELVIVTPLSILNHIHRGWFWSLLILWLCTFLHAY